MQHPPSSSLARRLLSALVVGVLALGALVTAGVPATAATARSISISSNPTSGAVGSTVVVSGTVSKSPKGSAVVVQRKSGGSWVTARSVKTSNADGRYTARITLPTKYGTYSYRAVASARGNLKTATSKTLKIAALNPVSVTFKATPKPPARMAAGGRATVSGSVKPFTKGTTVTIQRFGTRDWVSTGVTTKLTAKGTFSAKIPLIDGSVLRAATSRSGSKAPGFSAPAAVVVNPVISSTALPTASRTFPYSELLRQVGTKPGTWSVSPALPPGLSLNAKTGRVSGTPTTNSSASYTFKLAQPGLTTASKSVRLTIADPTPPVIRTANLPEGVIGKAYYAVLIADGNPSQGTWTAAPLPAGLTFSAASGIIGGIPAAGTAGTTTVTLGFTQERTGLKAQSKTVTLVIGTGGKPAPIIDTKTLPKKTFLASYEAQLEASGDPDGGTWSATGLPNGFTLNAETGVITAGFLTFPVGTYEITLNFTANGNPKPATPVTVTLTVG